MKTPIFLLILLAVFQPALAQEKDLTLEDALIGRYSYLAPDQPRQLKWRDANHYVLVENEQLVQFSTKKEQSEVILKLEELQQAAAKIDIEIKYFPTVNFINENLLKINLPNRLLIYDLTQKEFSLILNTPKDSEKKDFCEANQTIAYVKGSNLYTLNNKGEKQVTHETENGILCGHEVHRREFGIHKGTFWSPKGNYLAFYRKDERMVKDYPLVNYMAREAEHTPVKYPMAGMKSHHVTLGVYNLKTEETIFLKTGEPKEHYLTNISWDPNEEYIYLAELNRDQNHMQLNQYRINDGEKIKTLFEEKSKTYVEPQHPIIFSKKNPEIFFYQSRVDGWSHIYIYNVYGKKLKQLTKGNWEVTNFYGFDEDEKNIFIQATKESPTERHIYKVNVSNDKLTKLSNESGTHQASFSTDKSLMLDKWSAYDVPSKTELINSNGKFIRNVHTAQNNASDFRFGENKLFSIKTADNKTDLFCRMILPPDFDSSKKYPVIIYVYGGPHAQLVNNSWHNSARWWQYYMASKGYIAFTLDNRGSANRGKAFEDAIHKQMGTLETADQMQGINYLKTLSYVDSSRIGVHGWSYGGFMTLNLMLHHPETFKVGVAGGPVVDWKMYEIMYGERYMDHPDDNPDGYKNSNLANHVHKLEGKLMLIHGAQDQTVVMQHSMKFLRECVKQNKPVDFFVYPIHPHNVRGKDRIHLMEKVSQYFIDYL